MQKVLQIYYEPVPSGQSSHVLSLARWLDRSKFSVTVVLPDWLHPSIHALKQTGVRVVPLPMRKIFWTRAARVGLLDLIKRQQFDIVHVHSQEAGLVVRPLLRQWGMRKIIYTPQTIDIRCSRWQFLYIAVERALAALTSQVISVNHMDRERMLHWGFPPCKVITIPNGVDLPPAQEAEDADTARQKLNRPADGPLIMQVGRLSVQKDPYMFLEGARSVLRECPAAQWVWIGEGPLKKELALQIQKMNLEGKVWLVGRMENAAACMAAASVVTLTSRWEGTPYALLEAMARSRPVVATRVNGCIEVVSEGETGFLVPPGDFRNWGKQIVRLLKDPVLAAAFGKRGRVRVERNYSRQAMIQAIEAVYQQP